MRILFAAAEVAPYFKTGGLGDVARALPDVLARRGHDVRVILPGYPSVDRSALDLTLEREDTVPWPGALVPVGYARHRAADGAHAVFVDQPAFFASGTPYDASRTDPLATARRFAFFCRTIVQYARAWDAHVVHLNDWQTGLVPVYGMLDGLDAGTVFTIHNLGYQGNYPAQLLLQSGIPGEFFRTENGVEFFGHVSFMKTGLALSDRITTVSPTYADEIQTGAFGGGMDGLLRFRRRDLDGILNGIDTDTWNPGQDEALAAPYTSGRMGAKEQSREALVKETGLQPDGPIVALVTRLAYQKGVDLLLAALPALMRAGIRLVILGSGEAKYEQTLARAAATFPGRLASFARFDDRLARRIYAGADFFLMPSLYEPCGLGQMIAQRYGTPPIVRYTGGLADTVEDGRTGFVFRDATVDSMMEAVLRARDAWRARGWVSLRRRCMRLDWSWDRSAERYEELYRCLAPRDAG